MEYKHREKNQRDTDSLYFVEIWEENKNVHSDGWKGKKKKNRKEKYFEAVLKHNYRYIPF